MNYLYILFALATLPVFAQEDKTLSVLDSIIEQKPWSLKATASLNGTQSSFVNWSAGGRNNISAIGFIDASAKYKKGRVKWDSDLKFALGGVRYIDSVGNREGLQKTDDRIDLATSVGYEFEKKWFYTFVAGFRTQSLDGFNFPNDSVRISGFMAPAYVSLSLGIEYVPNPAFNIYLSPAALKITIVNDQRLADAGAFGVQPAVLNSDSTAVLIPGKRVRTEIGAYFRLRFQKEIMKNVEMKTRIELFSNYLHNPGNIDVNAENSFIFKVNDWFNASVLWNLIYDDDISIVSRNGTVGPRTQFKSVLGLGISYTFIK